ncbi:hypothetical protein [Aureispira anguillae]|uniref:Uncharacterized protein n=1 Tax=Aureispira anguillae TaxID=2864201 RepID=A0A915YGQ1_9BACT|nr:hypothetical protein [Aureispira anguillae]BDS12727.1 hypothetical protein AsAng_0034520 [Aureispira anguillae]
MNLTPEETICQIDSPINIVSEQLWGILKSDKNLISEKKSLNSFKFKSRETYEWNFPLVLSKYEGSISLSKNKNSTIVISKINIQSATKNILTFFVMLSILFTPIILYGLVNPESMGVEKETSLLRLIYLMIMILIPISIYLKLKLFKKLGISTEQYVMTKLNSILKEEK